VGSRRRFHVHGTLEGAGSRKTFQDLPNQNDLNTFSRVCSIFQRNSSETGTTFIRVVERSALELTTRILKDEAFASDGRYQNGYEDKDFNMGCGAQIKDEMENDKISYPFSYSPEKDSYIEIPSNWAEYFAEQEIEFTGMEIDCQLVNMMFPGSLDPEDEYGWSHTLKSFKHLKL